MLKEKNKLMSDKLLAAQLQQQYQVHNNVRKVKLSMARLLTVVNERKILRDKYRQYLEEQYIDEKKKEEIRDRLEAVSNHSLFIIYNSSITIHYPYVYQTLCIARQRYDRVRGDGESRRI